MYVCMYSFMYAEAMKLNAKLETVMADADWPRETNQDMIDEITNPVILDKLPHGAVDATKIVEAALWFCEQDGTWDSCQHHAFVDGFVNYLHFPAGVMLTDNCKVRLCLHVDALNLKELMDHVILRGVATLSWSIVRNKIVHWLKSMQYSCVSIEGGIMAHESFVKDDPDIDTECFTKALEAGKARLDDVVGQVTAYHSKTSADCIKKVKELGGDVIYGEPNWSGGVSTLTDRHTCIQTDRQTDTQTDRCIHTYIHTCMHTHTQELEQEATTTLLTVKGDVFEKAVISASAALHEWYEFREAMGWQLKTTIMKYFDTVITTGHVSIFEGKVLLSMTQITQAAELRKQVLKEIKSSGAP